MHRLSASSALLVLWPSGSVSLQRGRCSATPAGGMLRSWRVGLEVIVNHGGSAMTQTPQLCALGAALGTEALGIDLSKPLDSDTFAWIQAAFAEHPVLVFRDQDLGAPELAAFGRRFGVAHPHALTKY